MTRRIARGSPGVEPARRWRGLPVLAALCGVLLGCAHVQWRAPALPAEQLVERMREGGWELQHPFELDPEALQVVRETLGRYGTEEERLQRAVAWVNGASGLHFEYTPGVTLPAAEAFRVRKGDCMTYAALLSAVARGLGVHAYFVYVDGMPIHYDAEGWLFTASHIAVGLGSSASRAVVVDFVANQSEWTGSMYQPVHDHVAASLYFSNRAVERLIRGDHAGAERMLRALIAFEPQVREPHGNLGAVLLRQGRAAEALAAMEGALQRFPADMTLHTNAIRAARALGDVERARRLEMAAERVARSAPMLQFMRGVNAYRAGDYRGAVDHLEHAVAGMAGGTLVRAWLVRAYVATAEPTRGQELFAALSLEAPDSPLVEALARDFPQLQREERPRLPEGAPALAKARRKGRGTSASGGVAPSVP